MDVALYRLLRAFHLGWITALEEAVAVSTELMVGGYSAQILRLGADQILSLDVAVLLHQLGNFAHLLTLLWEWWAIKREMVISFCVSGTGQNSWLLYRLYVHDLRDRGEM